MATVPPAEGILASDGKQTPVDSPVIASALDGPQFTPGQRVRHRAYGYGEVRENEADKALVEFPKRKKKLLVRIEFLIVA